MLEGPDRPLFPEGVPMALGMAMLQYPGAMEEEAQRNWIEGAKSAPSERELWNYVMRFVTGGLS